MVFVDSFEEISPALDLSFQPIPLAALKNYPFLLLYSEGHPDQPPYGILIYRILNPEITEILHFAIHPDRRNHGYGKALLRELTRRRKASSAQKLWLEVEATNHVARHLYESTGFRQNGVRRHYYGLERSAINYALDL